MNSLRVWAYNAFFVVALPPLLAAWALASARVISLPAPPQQLGPPMLLAGVLLLVWGVASFMTETGVVPSNAAPPTRRATGGPYAVFSDPIYVGAALAAFGAAAWLGSAPGFWLVAPSLTLAAAALVFGREALMRPPLEQEKQRSLCSLPCGTDAAPTLRQRCGGALQIGAWITTIALIQLATGAEPRVPDASIIAASLIALLAPFAPWLRSTWALRRMLIAFHVAMIAGVVLFLGPAAPAQWGRAEWMPLAASIGVLAGAPASFGGAWRRLVYLACLAVVVAVALAASIATSLRSAAAVAIIAALCAPLHQVLLIGSEAIANSWSAIRIGPVRIINYAGYAFAAAAIGALIFFAVVGEKAIGAALIIAVCVVVSAGLWGQLVEFSGRLARPFGYYGALIGAFLGVALAAAALSLSPWLLGAGLALGAPVVQATGRLRCLVQGCCHGGRVNAAARGIVYRRPESRVLRIAKLGNQPVHPTPLYSIYANAFALLVLLRIAFAGAPQTAIIAVYLIVSGALRFIEEAYRGEPQTPRWRGLKLYQWLAVGQGLAGVALSLAPSEPMPPLTPPGAAEAAAALLVGVIAGFAMGVDFPRLRSRFSQLTPTDL